MEVFYKPWLVAYLGVEVVVILVEMPDDAIVAVGQAVLGDEPFTSSVSPAQSEDSSHLPRWAKVKL